MSSGNQMRVEIPGLADDLSAAVAARRERLIDLTRALVAQPSTLGNESGAQAVVEEVLANIGFAVSRVEPDANAALADPTAGYPYLPYGNGRSCVVGHLDGTGGGRSIHLSGHVDVVPVERPDLWSHDPWKGEIADGRMYGRGAGDMKGGVAAYLVAAEAVAELCPDRRGDLIFSTVIEEECTGNGMWSVIQAGHVGDAVLVGECTDLTYIHAATGVVWCRLVAKGVDGHSMLAAGAGSFEMLARAVAGLRIVEDEINAAVGDPDFAAVRERPYGMTVGKLEGGVWTSSTPHELTAYIRFGFGPETPPQEIQERMRSAVQSSAPGVEIIFEGFRAHAYNRAASSPLGDALAAAHLLVQGEPVAPRVSTGTVDSRYVNTVPSYCYGPLAGNIHGTDEWVDIDSQVAAATTVALTAAAWTA